MASCYAELSKISKTKECREKALEIRREIGDRSGEAGALSGLGDYQLSIGKTQRGKELYEESLQIYCEIKERSSQGATIGSLGDCYLNFGDTKTAIDYYNQALEIARETKRRRSESMRLRDLANAANYEKRFQDAIEFATQSRTLGAEMESPYDGSYCNTYLAEAYLFSDKLDEAHSAIDLALQFNIPLNNHKAQSLLGVITLGKDDVLTAKQAFLSAIDKADEILSHNEKSFRALDIKGLALCGLSFCEKSEDFSVAKQAFKSVRTINKDLGGRLQISRLLDTLAQISKTSLLEEVKIIASGLNQT